MRVAANELRRRRIGQDQELLRLNRSHHQFADLIRLHFVAALPNSRYFEYCVEPGALRQTLTRQRFPVRDGDIPVPEEPGLGVELDEAVVARYRVG